MEEWPKSSFKVDSGRRRNLTKSSTMTDFLSCSMCERISEKLYETTIAEQVAKSYGENAKHGKHINSALDHQYHMFKS